MATNKKRKKSSYQKPKSDYTPTHSKGTRIFVLVMALFMVIGLLVTMIAYIILSVVDDDHDHDNESSRRPVSSVTSSNKGSGNTVDTKPTTTTSSSAATSDSTATATTESASADSVQSEAK